MEKKKENLLMLLSGAFVGLVNGIFGGGGGMLVVPLLVALMKKIPRSRTPPRSPSSCRSPW